MAELLRKGWHERPLSVTGLALACASLLAFAVVLVMSLAHLASFTLSAGELVGKERSAAASRAVMHFRFRGVTRFVRVSVDPLELHAARRLDTSRVFSTVGPVRAAYVRNLVAATSGTRTVSEIAEQLRGIRAELGLDDDSYVELIARFVQEIPYGTLDSQVRLPIQVVAEGEGVCDDKSILLAAILVHEGYDTAVWAFDSQAHAAVGVRCLGPGMHGSGYAYIETTAPAYIGQVGGTYGSYARWRRAPQLIRVGGAKRYRADLESEFIASTMERARSAARRLEPYWDLLGQASPRWGEEYQVAARQQAEAQSLASWLLLARDDRGAAYALLTSSGGR